jgi:hypothetical protein
MIIINYQEEIARVLQAVDYSEDNFRFENYAGGFVFSRTTFTRFFYPLNVDWLVRFQGTTIREVCEKMTNFYLRDDPDAYYSSWIQGKPTFRAHCGRDESGNDDAKTFPIKYTKLTDKQKHLSEIIMELHSRQIFFRMEYIWDGDGRVSIVDPNVKPSNVETDIMNIAAHPDLSVVTAEKYNDLKPLPEKDWIEKLDVEKFEDANDWLSRYIKPPKSNRVRSI